MTLILLKSQHSIGLQTSNVDVTPDGRFGSRCFPWANDPSREFCRISFYRLLSSPEQYDGRLVRVSGFLARVFGQPILYVNRYSYESGVEEEGILVDTKILPEGVQNSIDKGVWPVVVVGEFDAKYVGSDGVYRLGALRNIQGIYPVILINKSK